MTPQTFRKKPVEIEAVQWTGDNWEHLIPFIGDVGTLGPQNESNPSVVEIATLEGVMTAQPGDWIIRGVQGEFYPCKPDIFEATYERVDTCSWCPNPESPEHAAHASAEEF